MMAKRWVLLLSCLAFVGLSACVSNLSGESYSREEARRSQTVLYGTVLGVRPVQLEGTKSALGVGTGAVVGGVVGSTVGGGKGSQVAAVLGAVAGGLAGAAVEEQGTKAQGVEITVKLEESGKIIAIVQQAGSETFVEGSRVRVLKSGATLRVAK